jgi:hypothetical protein
MGSLLDENSAEVIKFEEVDVQLFVFAVVFPPKEFNVSSSRCFGLLFSWKRWKHIPLTVCEWQEWSSVASDAPSPHRPYK